MELEFRLECMEFAGVYGVQAGVYGVQAGVYGVQAGVYGVQGLWLWFMLECMEFRLEFDDVCTQSLGIWVRGGGVYITRFRENSLCFFDASVVCLDDIRMMWELKQWDPVDVGHGVCVLLVAKCVSVGVCDRDCVFVLVGCI